MKLCTRLARKFIHKLYYVTGAAYEFNEDAYTRNTDLLKCNRRGLKAVTIIQLRHLTTTTNNSNNNNTELEKPPWRVLFFGADDFSLPSLKMLFRELQDGGLVNRLAVVTSLKAKKNPIRDFAVAAELSIFNWPFPVVPGNYDVGLVASFGHLIPKSIIESLPLGILNVHASLLPRWRGAAPIIYAILNGDSETGVTIMQVKPHKFDIGNIVLQESCPITPMDTASMLKVHLAELGCKLLQEALKDLPHCLHKSIPQPDSGITYAPRVTSSLAAIKWQNMEAREIYNLHRALTGLYSLTTTWHGLPIKLLEPSLETGTCKQEQQTRSSWSLKRPGCVEFDHKGHFLHVLCADSKWISFRAVVVPGKKPMSPKDFYNGYMSKRSVNEWTFT